MKHRRRVRRLALLAVVAVIPAVSSCAVPVPAFIYDDGNPRTLCVLQILEPFTGGNPEHGAEPHVDCIQIF